MFAVIFETLPNRQRFSDYLGLAETLKPTLNAIDGFVMNERFSNDRVKGTLLSLSLWRDEKALIRWRTHAQHHGVQVNGRSGVLDDYRLRVGQIDLQFESGKLRRATEGRRRDISAVSTDPFVTISVSTRDIADPDAAGMTPPQDQADERCSDFTGVVDTRRRLRMTRWADADQAERHLLEHCAALDGAHWAVSVVREYGMLDRREAPVFHEPVER